jgi:acid stress chaperone HdeB
MLRTRITAQHPSRFTRAKRFSAQQESPPLRFSRAALIATCLVSASPCQAQTIDLATLKCKEFIDLSKETIATLTVWLDGYYTDEEDAAVFEPDKLKIKAEKLSAFCAQNPKIGLMTAAESVMAK